MNTSRHRVAKNELSPLQKKSLQRFKRKVTEKMPDLRIAWTLPYNDTTIEMRLEDDKFTYRRSLKASKLAFEVAEETGVTIIFR